MHSENIDVSELPEEVAADIFNRMYETASNSAANIKETYARSAENLSGKFGAYIVGEGDDVDFDYAAFGKDMMDIACVLSGVAENDTEKLLTGADVFRAAAYLITCVDIGHCHVEESRALVESINESLSIYESVPDGLKRNPLVYMQQMGKFRDELENDGI